MLQIRDMHVLKLEYLPMSNTLLRAIMKNEIRMHVYSSTAGGTSTKTITDGQTRKRLTKDGE